MTGQNNIEDKHIRELLRRRLLEQDGDDDQLTHKLIDMEAKIAFGEEALLLPPLQKEKELLIKLQGTGNSNGIQRYLLPGLVVLASAALTIYFYLPQKEKQAIAAIESSGNVIKHSLPTIQTHTIESTDSAMPATVSTIKVTVEPGDRSDTSVLLREERWTIGDPGIRVEPQSQVKKRTTIYLDPYENVPVLSEKEKAWTRKQKEKLVKGIMKPNKGGYVSYIPASTEEIEGKTVSVQGFYIFNMEISNNTYRIFTNDLLMSGKLDEYVKAVPDTAKWMIRDRPF